MKNKKTKIGKSLNMAAASTKTGVPREIIRAAKSLGVNAFDTAGRVNCDALIKELKRPGNATVVAAGNAAISKREAELNRLLLQCEKLKFENELARGEYVLKSEITHWIVGKIEQIKSVLNQSLRNELPPKLVGLQPDEISAAMEPIIFKICVEMKRPMGG